MWLKYYNEPIRLSEIEDRSQPDASKYTKPRGCWITDDTENCWRSWCIGEQFQLEYLTHKHEVVIDETSVLILRSPYELDAFTSEFAVERPWSWEGRKYVDRCIDWREVAKRYDGLVVTPYLWARRMELDWYYGWDCASGCIWKAGAIKEIRLLEIDLDVAKPREAEAA